ncbi:MAG: hypothetical protein HOM14_19320 [Gammaproteobacteria bacterium]|jgi:hypothetical protein|nr:hypothetical protein [Gammaproteobacteria bacterium]MBT3722563.1 hypothetical protein [Gammaproteobacteria bacterium]MBT4196992.1 hypothetical protein [Gammaproteobacteria bacterium]MBT4451847.1 hypothetical protein [Gammaproteobacteria bacterium]MBT4860758.1 hypothetical protein [Gammaproteobacteria bacterium]
MTSQKKQKTPKSLTKAKSDLATVEQVAVSTQASACRNITAAASGFKDSGLKPQELIEYLNETSKEICRTDMHHAQVMLSNQAIALESLFTTLTEKAFSSDQIHHFESFMRLALRAQTQSRCTLEAISNIKNPRTVIAKQANISHGHQQINNGLAPQAQESKESPFKQSGEDNELLTDKSNEGAAIEVNSPMETLEKEHRT